MVITDIAIVFLLCAVTYCYVLYPFVIRLLARMDPTTSVMDQSIRPIVSIILAVYNEELVLEKCLDSLLRLEYPVDLLEIIVGSDGSSDRTNSILADFQKKHSMIKPFYFPTRRGKMMVLNDLIPNTKGELLYFVDADITLSANSVLVQTRHFADKQVGAVAGAYAIHSEKKQALYKTEKEYVFIEEAIRQNESKYFSTVGLFGGNYMMRKTLWRLLPDRLVHDDLYSVLTVLSQSKRIIFEPESTSTDRYERSITEEFKRKARFASRGFHTLSFFPELLGFSSGKIAFLLWSHKILRWTSPFLLILVVILSLFGFAFERGLLDEVILSGSIIVLLLALLGQLSDKMNLRIPVVRQVSWFLIMIIAYAVGTLRFLFKTDKAMWVPATRPPIESLKLLREGVEKK